jgi:hypothetical protein
MVATFASAARKQIAREKKLASLTLTCRATFKATGRTTYDIRSTENSHYHVVTENGKVYSCTNQDSGLECEGRMYTGHCYHGDFALAFEQAHGALEARRQEELAVAEQVVAALMPEMVEDLTAHVEDELTAQDAAWAVMTPMQRRAAYSELYPDDYGYVA